MLHGYSCHNRYFKGSGVRFYCFPILHDRHRQWLTFVSRQNLDELPREPGDGDRVCFCHFIFWQKSNLPMSPDYTLSLCPVILYPIVCLTFKEVKLERRVFGVVGTHSAGTRAASASV